MNPRGPAGGARRPARRVARLLLASLLAIAMAAPAAPVPGPTEDELRVHAAYLMNFVRYSRWPGAAEGPRVVAVLGTGDDARVLRELAMRAGAIDGRALSVRLVPLGTVPPAHTAAVQALSGVVASSHVLYVGASHQGWARAVAAATAGRPVLTVGPGPGFVAAGGMFGMYRDRGHVRFSVNAPAIKASPVDVSARLLVLARPGPGG